MSGIESTEMRLRKSCGVVTPAIVMFGLTSSLAIRAVADKNERAKDAPAYETAQRDDAALLGDRVPAEAVV